MKSIPAVLIQHVKIYVVDGFCFQFLHHATEQKLFFFFGMIGKRKFFADDSVHLIVVQSSVKRNQWQQLTRNVVRYF